jgi:serine/threonine-protein kinase
VERTLPSPIEPDGHASAPRVRAASGLSLDLDAMAARRVGRTVRGKYTLDAVLGVGGMAALYAATHRAGHRVALKIAHPVLAPRVNASAWLLREATAMNQVRHAGIVRVHDDDVAEDGSPFLVLELLEGETLAARTARLGHLPAGVVLHLADRTLEILAAVHAAGLVHCDVKPDNLFLTADGRLVLLDFGIARRFGEAYDDMADVPMGTPDFMPPEQAAARWSWVDARADLYAVGATMFALLAQRSVHAGGSVRSQLEHARTAHAPPLASVAPSVRHVLAEVVDRALAFDPDARWPSAEAMREAVRRAHAQYLAAGQERRTRSGVLRRKVEGSPTLVPPSRARGA